MTITLTVLTSFALGALLVLALNANRERARRRDREIVRRLHRYLAHTDRRPW